MSETTEKHPPGCSPFQAFEMENKTSIELNQSPSRAEMQAGTAIPAQGKEVASIRKQVRSKRKNAEAESPYPFLKGWRTEIRYRESGATAGSKDKYYVEEATGYRFRSKPEVKKYIETGKKPKPKSKLLGSVKDEASAAPPSTNSLIFKTPDLNATPQRVTELEYVNSPTKSKQQRPASDGQKQGQKWENQNTSKMWGLHNSGNTEKKQKISHPVTGKALDYSLASSFTPTSQGGVHAPGQNENLLSKHNGIVSTGETVSPPDMLVVDISDESTENTAPKPSETGFGPGEWQVTKQSMAPSVSDQAGCHGNLNSHNQPCYTIMPLVNGSLNPGHCSTILGGSLKAVPFSDPPRSPRSVLHHDSDNFHSDLQVQHKPSRGRPKGSKNVGNPREMKRQFAEQLAERGRKLCKQYLEMAKSLPPA